MFVCFGYDTLFRKALYLVFYAKWVKERFVNRCQLQHSFWIHTQGGLSVSPRFTGARHDTVLFSTRKSITHLKKITKATVLRATATAVLYELVMKLCFKFSI